MDMELIVGVMPAAEDTSPLDSKSLLVSSVRPLVERKKRGKKLAPVPAASASAKFSANF